MRRAILIGACAVAVVFLAVGDTAKATHLNMLALHVGSTYTTGETVVCDTKEDASQVLLSANPLEMLDKKELAGVCRSIFPQMVFTVVRLAEVLEVNGGSVNVVEVTIDEKTAFTFYNIPVVGAK